MKKVLIADKMSIQAEKVFTANYTQTLRFSVSMKKHDHVEM